MVATSTAWPVQEAKARFSELLDTCLASGPQTISRRSVPLAVIVSLDEWKQATAPHPTLTSLLLADEGRFSIDLPERGQWRHREIEAD
ncbi:MAG: type II toxin-antitoxin system Phd/YefM family antitoxin [Micrococcales bacterium]|nr:type II toxin-antitoxin system Phd/YefM family antitoxin [Micrococcales bacterium]